LRGCLNDKHFWNKRLYTVDPVERLVRRAGIRAQHFRFAVLAGQAQLRREMLATIARQDRVPVVMVNQVGGNDSLCSTAPARAEFRREVRARQVVREDLVYFDSERLTGELHPQIPGRSQRVRRAGAGHARLCSQVRL
jgi:hypothetical protein